MTRKKEINSPARNCWWTTADGLPAAWTPVGVVQVPTYTERTPLL